jgi:predicted MFS family arabinose efflux permease
MGAAIAVSPLSLGMAWPLPAVCLASFFLGIVMEITMVQWTVAMARNIPRVKLARVSSYDVLGSVVAMPVGALVAGPVAAAIGVSATDYGAVAVIIVASALALIPREVRSMRAGAAASGHDGPGHGELPGPEVGLPDGGEPFVRPAGRAK